MSELDEIRANLTATEAEHLNAYLLGWCQGALANLPGGPEEWAAGLAHGQRFIAETRARMDAAKVSAP